MKPKDLILRCYGKRDGDQWVAVCVDLCLAAQGDSMDQARGKLHAQIHDYLSDAIVGDDRDHAEYLLNRKAPLSQLATYHGIRLLKKIHALRNGAYTLFPETMPVQFKAA